MKPCWLAPTVIFWFATGLAQARIDSHSGPSDFLQGWIEGCARFDSSGRLALGTEEDSLPTSIALSRKAPGAVPDFLASAPTLIANAWKGRYSLDTSYVGPPALFFQNFGEPGFRAGGLPKAEFSDLDWYHGNLYILMKPPKASATSVHLYRLASAPNGSLGSQQLAALAPPGSILERLAVVEDRLFAVGREVGDESRRLFELRGVAGPHPGWFDLGPLGSFETRAWDFQSGGDTLVLYESGARVVDTAGIPPAGSPAEWNRRRLEGGAWADAMRSLFFELDNRRDRSALVANRFQLPGRARIKSLKVESEEPTPPQIRFRTASDEAGLYEEWSHPAQFASVPVDRDAQFLQYEILQSADRDPVAIKAIEIEWEAPFGIDADATFPVANGNIEAKEGGSRNRATKPHYSPTENLSFQEGGTSNEDFLGNKSAERQGIDAVVLVERLTQSLDDALKSHSETNPVQADIPAIEVTLPGPRQSPDEGLKDGPLSSLTSPVGEETGEDSRPALDSRFRGNDGKGSGNDGEENGNDGKEGGNGGRNGGDNGDMGGNDRDPGGNEGDDVQHDGGGGDDGESDNVEAGEDGETGANDLSRGEKDRRESEEAPVGGGSEAGREVSEGDEGSPSTEAEEPSEEGGAPDNTQDPTDNGANGGAGTLNPISLPSNSSSSTNPTRNGKDPSASGTADSGLRMGATDGGRLAEGDRVSTAPSGSPARGKHMPGTKSDGTTPATSASALPSASDGSNNHSLTAAAPNPADSAAMGPQSTSPLPQSKSHRSPSNTHFPDSHLPHSRSHFSPSASHFPDSHLPNSDPSFRHSNPSSRHSRESGNPGEGAAPLPPDGSGNQDGVPTSGADDSSGAAPVADRPEGAQIFGTLSRPSGIHGGSSGKGFPLLEKLAAQKRDLAVKNGSGSFGEGRVNPKPWWGWLIVLLLLLLAALAQRVNQSLPNRIPQRAPLAVPRFLHPEEWERRKTEETAFENNRALRSVSDADSDAAESLNSLSQSETFPRTDGRIVWQVAEPLPAPMAPAAAFYRSGQVYVVDPHGTVCSARVGSDGVLCPWGVRIGRLPTAAGACGIAALDRLLVSQTKDRLQVAGIDENGVGEWRDAGRVPGIGGRPALAGTGNRLYLAGGAGDRGNLPLVRSIDFDALGRVERIEAQAPLPKGIADGSITVGGKRIYWVGGREDSTWTGTVFSAPVAENGDLGEWVLEPPLPMGLRKPSLQIWDSVLWVVGGGHARNRVFAAPLNAVGRLSSWSEMDSELPDPLEGSACLRAGGRFLLLGGANVGPHPHPNCDVYWWSPTST